MSADGGQVGTISHDSHSGTVVSDLSNHAIICGFGLPGRAVARVLESQHIDYCIVELNPATVDRCARTGVQIIHGDARDPETLRRAGVERAQILALAIPNDAVVLDAVKAGRQLNPSVYIVARLHFTSAGIEAHRRGANETVVAEQVVANEFSRLIEARRSVSH